MPLENSEKPYPEQPEEQGRLRDQAGRQRDTAAGLRDDRSARRDQAADIRDQDAYRRPGQHLHVAGGDTGTNAIVDVTAVLRAADSDRAHAHVDRIAAGNDRTDAAIDRQAALADRMSAARDRRQASLDGLTGVYNREAGLLEMTRDLARTSRTGQLPVVAFLDVDQLKAINDTHGHAAGDRALLAVADTLTTALRPYDLIIRYGGDEFLCTVEGLDLHAARHRFTHINALVATTTHGVSVTVGLVRLRAGETTESVIGRADADLYEQRKQRSHHRP